MGLAALAWVASMNNDLGCDPKHQDAHVWPAQVDASVEQLP